MFKKLLGMGTGLAMGVAAFAAPASASTTLVLDDGSGTHVGSVDLFLGACVADGGGLATEVACINSVTGLAFITSDALKMDDLVATDFTEVDDTATAGYDDDWAIVLAKQGGWFSVKTGNIACNAGATGVVGLVCDPNEKQYYLIFQNLSLFTYGVFDLDELSDVFGYDLADIGKISHITIVPLPAAALLFGSALLGGGLMRRRKMIKRSALPA